MKSKLHLASSRLSFDPLSPKNITIEHEEPVSAYWSKPITAVVNESKDVPQTVFSTPKSQKRKRSRENKRKLAFSKSSKIYNLIGKVHRSQQKQAQMNLRFDSSQKDDSSVLVSPSAKQMALTLR